MSRDAKSSRARQNAFDMLRTLVVVLAVVVPLWFFGQASDEDTKRIRPVDATEAFRAFVADTGGPVPGTLPPGWVTNVARAEDGVVRVGYVVGEHYLEWQGSRGTGFLQAATGEGRRTGSEVIAGATWETWENADGAQSLVLRRGDATVLVGGFRETASADELRRLAASVR